MANIDLPDPFKRIITSYFTLRQLKIEAAYLDSKEWHPPRQGVGCLRELLKLTDSDTCTDGYFVIRYGEEQFGVLIEDKNSRSTRSRNVNDGIQQMADTHKRLREAYFPQGGTTPLKYAFLSGVKLGGNLYAKTVAERNVKVLFNGMNNRPITLNDSNVEIFVV